MSRIFLTIVLLDVCRLEILWVLDDVEDTAEGRETIGVVSKLCSASCVDDVPCIHNGIGYLFPIVPTVVVVAVAWREISTFGRTNPAHFFALIPFPAGCMSDFVFISWSVLGQIVY